MSNVAEFVSARVLTLRQGLPIADQRLPAFVKIHGVFDGEFGLMEVVPTTKEGELLSRGSGIYVLQRERLERCYEGNAQPA